MCKSFANKVKRIDGSQLRGLSISSTSSLSFSFLSPFSLPFRTPLLRATVTQRAHTHRSTSWFECERVWFERKEREEDTKETNAEKEELQLRRRQRELEEKRERRGSERSRLMARQVVYGGLEERGEGGDGRGGRHYSDGVYAYSFHKREWRHVSTTGPKVVLLSCNFLSYAHAYICAPAHTHTFLLTPSTSLFYTFLPFSRIGRAVTSTLQLSVRLPPSPLLSPSLLLLPATLSLPSLFLLPHPLSSRS